MYETVINSNKTEELCYVLGFDNYFIVYRECCGDDVALCWRNSMNCTINKKSLNHIDFEVVDTGFL